MFSLDLGRLVSFPAGTAGGSNQSPGVVGGRDEAGIFLGALGHPEIWVADASGGNLHQLTSFGPMSRRCGIRAPATQIALVSGRTGEPQIYIMDQDGANVQRMTDSGYAISPSWSPNGAMLAFSWNRKYGPGDPGGQDIYVMDIASKRWLQATHESGTTIFRRGRRTGGTSFSSADRAPHADLVDAGRRHGAASADLHAATTRCRTGAGSEFAS